FLRCLRLLRLIGNEYGVVLSAFFEICGEPFAIFVRHLVDIHALEPLLLPFFASALRGNDRDDSFCRTFGQVDADEQQSAWPRQVGFGKASADEGKPHSKLADRFAMTARRLGIRDLSGLGVSVDQRYAGRKVGVITRAATAVSHLFRLLGRRSLMCAERVEAFEDESTVVAEQLVEPKYS